MLVDMLPNLSNVVKVDSSCLPDPFNAPRAPGVDEKSRLRGHDAVFWTVQGEELVLDPTLYPNNEFDEGEDEENAQNAREMIQKSRVQPTPMPVTGALFHWTDSLPVNLEVGDIVATQGYNWTSTSGTFVWFRPVRIVIVVPQDTPGWISVF